MADPGHIVYETSAAVKMPEYPGIWMAECLDGDAVIKAGKPFPQAFSYCVGGPFQARLNSTHEKCGDWFVLV
jgi:hypothetical protein